MYASRPRPPLIVYVLRTDSGAFERFVISSFPPADAERLFSTPHRALARVVVRHLSSSLRTVADHPVVRPSWPAPRHLPTAFARWP